MKDCFTMTVDEILHQYDLKNTGCRKFILAELLQSESALSEEEIKKPFPDLFDRVTFYRTLKTLEERGIIHRIVLNDNSVKYALNGHHPDQNRLHAHFHCGKCDEVLCLQGKTRFDAELPPDFVSQEVFVVIEGLCADCRHQSQPV
jgi:Fur family ferric uptake transcriptional regulator